MGDVRQALPAIEILSFDVEWVPRARPIALRSGPRACAPHPALARLDAWCTAVAMARCRYEARIGSYAGLRPRRESSVEHHVDRTVDEVLDALRGYDHLLVGSDRVRLEADVRSLVRVPMSHEHRVPAVLHLAWSWPDLPMWLTISEWSPRWCSLILSLRSRRRLRYPVRYWDATHTALDLVERHAIAPRAIDPPAVVALA